MRNVRHHQTACPARESAPVPRGSSQPPHGSPKSQPLSCVPTQSASARLRSTPSPADPVSPQEVPYMASPQPSVAPDTSPAPPSPPDCGIPPPVLPPGESLPPSVNSRQSDSSRHRPESFH